MDHVPVLIVIIPLCGAALCPLLSRFGPSLGKRAVIAALFIAFIMRLVPLAYVIQSGEAVHYWLGGWRPPYGIEFVIDGVNGIIIVLVCFIGFSAVPSRRHRRRRLSGAQDIIPFCASW